MNKQWLRISLGELLRLERRPIVVKPDGQYQEIGIYCFGRGVFHKTPRNGLEVGDKDLFQVKEGDFILQVTFGWEGAVALLTKADDGMFCSTRYPTFRVDETRCLPLFLLYYFRTAEGLDQLVRISPGSAGRNRVLSLKRIPEVLIPLPPLSEQRRIVVRIEKLAAQINEAFTLRRQAAEEAEALCRSILAADKNTKLTPLRELVRLRTPDVVVLPEGDYQFAGVYCFGRGVFRGQVRSGLEFAYPRLTRLRAGNFVYPKLMAWEGAFGVVPPECDGCVVSTEFPVFEVLQDQVFPEVLDTYFRNPIVWPEISGASTGTNVRRRRLNPRDFLAYKLPLPSREVQDRLRKVKAQMEVLNRLQAETATELDALLPAILDRAFRGEL
jgi:type I restriction enzyme S subunit